MRTSQQIKKHYGIEVDSAQEAQIKRDLRKAQAQARRRNEYFTDFDWAAVIEGALDRFGYRFTRMVSSERRRENMSRERLTARSRSRRSRSLLAEIDELEHRIAADDGVEQEAKAEKNQPVSASQKQSIARKLVSLANALITE